MRRLLTTGQPEPVPEMAALLATYDTRGRLAAARLPCVVVAGTRDNFVPKWHARRLADGLPEAEFVTFPRAGHLCMLEAPDGFNAVVAGAAGDQASGAGRRAGTDRIG